MQWLLTGVWVLCFSYGSSAFACPSDNLTPDTYWPVADYAKAVAQPVVASLSVAERAERGRDTEVNCVATEYSRVLWLQSDPALGRFYTIQQRNKQTLTSPLTKATSGETLRFDAEGMSLRFIGLMVEEACGIELIYPSIEPTFYFSMPTALSKVHACFFLGDVLAANGLELNRLDNGAKPSNKVQVVVVEHQG
ncbi:MAG: hypothetical protein CMF25_08240 [Kangiellaceae bacterium]|nr:hypothetical protein [Kangiellaceae bacterium]